MWEWSVSLNAELHQVEAVTYMLHPTVAKPVQTVTDLTSHFKLSASGWGTFTIHAKVHYRDGHETMLEHELELRYPDGSATTA